MACLPLEELLSSREGAEHAASCASCRAILERADTGIAPDACALAEVLLAARAAGPLTKENDERLVRHVAMCTGCLQLARALENSGVMGLVAGDCAATGSLTHEAGDLVGERYRVVRALGKGGMGEVYEVDDLVLKERVALKTLRESVAHDETSLLQFKREIQLARKVTHPNVCRTFDVGLERCGDRETAFLTMELLDGETLAARLRRVGRLDTAEALHIAEQIAAALGAAHAADIIHRDLKPGNIILVEAARGGTRAVVTDMGLARVAGGDADQASLEGLVGTPAYMAPEQVEGDRHLTPACDLYAFGVVLYEMVTGRRPFVADTALATAVMRLREPPPSPRTIVPDLDPRLERAILACLEPAPAARPATAEEVARILRPPAVASGWRQRWRLATVLALVVAGASSLVWWRIVRPRPQWSPAVRELRPASEEMINQPIFSPDGTRIAYGSDRSGGWRIYVDSLSDHSSRAIGPPLSYVSNLRWTRDGRAILCDEIPGASAYRIPVDGAPAESLGKDHDAPEDCGGRLLFVRASSPDCHGCPRLVVREADGRERDVVRRPANSRIMRPHCDAAGRRVIYGVIEPGRSLQQADIWIAGLDGESPRRLASAGLPNAAFHPTGDSVIVSLAESANFNLWDVPVDGRPAAQITFGAGVWGAPDVSPDGRMAIVMTSEHNWSWPVFAYSLSGAAGRRLTSRAELLTHLRVTPDGRQIIAGAERDGESYIVAMSTADGEEEVLARGDVPTLSPDGGEVIYSVRGPPTRIVAMPRKGGPQRLITVVAQSVLYLTAGPDGVLHMQVADSDDGAWRVPLAGGVAEREAPAPWTVVVPAPIGGWRAAFEGQEAHLLPPGAALDDPAAIVLRDVGEIAWDRDGASVVYVADGNMHRLRVADGKDVLLFGVRSDPFGARWLAVSPDGDSIYYVSSFGTMYAKLMTNFADRPRSR